MEVLLMFLDGAAQTYLQTTLWTVISTLSIDESNQSKQHRYKNLKWGSHLQDSYTPMYVPYSIVKFNDDQSKIGLISFMKKV